MEEKRNLEGHARPWACLDRQLWLAWSHILSWAHEYDIHLANMFIFLSDISQLRRWPPRKQLTNKNPRIEAPIVDGHSVREMETVLRRPRAEIGATRAEPWEKGR